MTAREPLDLRRLDELLGRLSGAHDDDRPLIALLLAAEAPKLVAEVRTLRMSEAEVVTALGEANDARLRLMAMCRDLTAEVKRLRPLVVAAIACHDYESVPTPGTPGGDLADAVSVLLGDGCPACGRLHFPWCGPYGGEWS